jgi:hypothetical protein
MLTPRLARRLPLAALLLLAACGSAEPPPAEAPPPPPASTAPTASATATAPAPSTATGIPRDPKLAEMAKAARACANGDHAYDYDRDCPGYKAWHDDEADFEDGKNGDTVFSLYADPDPKVHYLAMLKPIAPAYWENKEHAKALFALARAEKLDDILAKLAVFVAAVDAEKAGLGAELKELAKHPSSRFREWLATYLIQGAQTPLAFEVEQMLLADPSRDVRQNAIGGLAGEHTPASEPICQLLAKQLTRTDDDLYAVGIQVAASSKCPGLREQATAEIDRRTADPTTVTMVPGLAYTRALFSLCYRAEDPAQKKKKLFALAKRLVDARISDGMVRENALDMLRVCDRDAAEKLLPSLAKDKILGEKAKRALDSIKEQKAKDAKDRPKGKKK